MKKKEKQGAGIIGGADGPTSYFVLSKDRKPTVKQRLWRWQHKVKREWLEKHLSAEPHTLEEVCVRLQTKYGFSEISGETEDYQEEYRELRAEFLMQYAPDLLGELKELPELKGHSEDKIKQFMEEMEARKQKAFRVSAETFDIDLHLFKKQMGDSEYHILIEKKYAYIGGGASGSTATVRKFGKLFKEIYRYYGVSREDIDKKTKRYEDVVRCLSSK